MSAKRLLLSLDLPRVSVSHPLRLCPGAGASVVLNGREKAKVEAAARKLERCFHTRVAAVPLFAEPRANGRFPRLQTMRQLCANDWSWSLAAMRADSAMNHKCEPLLHRHDLLRSADSAPWR